MITNPTELAVQRELTAAFIAADFELITLIPRIEVTTGTGGRTWEDGVARVPQAFHVIERVSSARINTRVPGGEHGEEDFTLLGAWDVVIEVKDRFDFRGAQWEVSRVDWDNGYERRASVIRHGA